MGVLEEDGIFLNLRSNLLTSSIKVLETQVNAEAVCSKEWPNKLYWGAFLSWLVIMGRKRGQAKKNPYLIICKNLCKPIIPLYSIYWCIFSVIIIL
jgi:hypothetical protein